MFGNLYRLGTYVRPEYEESPLYACAAKGKEGFGAILCHYREEEERAQSVSLTLSGLAGKKNLSVFVLDEKRDMTKEKEIPLASDTLTLEFSLPPYTTLYFSIT